MRLHALTRWLASALGTPGTPQTLTTEIGSVSPLKSGILAAAALGLVSASLRAQTATGTMRLSGVNSNSGCYSTSSSGSGGECVYTDPYFAQFANLSTHSSLVPAGGGATFGPTADVFCVDFFHNATVGQTGSVYLTNLGNLGAGWLGTYTRSTSLEKYLESAWLAQQIDVVGANTRAGLEISGAIWQIMSGTPFYRQAGGSWYNNYLNTGIKYWRDLAVANWTGTSEQGVNASEWVVVTPTNLSDANSTQEFITQVTPEPETMILLGTGLLVMMLGAGAVKRLSA